MKSEKALTLSEVLGVNARLLRGDAKADQVAKAVRVYGLNWGTGRISDLEHGRVSATLPTLIALAGALGDVRGEPVTIADLMAHRGYLEVTAELTLKATSVQRFVNGQPVKLTLGDIAGAEDAIKEIRDHLSKIGSRTPRAVREVPMRLVSKVEAQQGEAEERVAKSLGIDTLTFAAVSAHLWRRSLSAERDRRAGRDANAQDRGRVTRALKAEMKEILDGND